MRNGLFVISAIMGLCVAIPAFAQDIDVLSVTETMIGDLHALTANMAIEP